MFETKGLINRFLMQELRKYMLPPRQNALLITNKIICACLIVFSLFIRNYLWLSLFVIAIVLFSFEGVFIKNKVIKTTLERMKESSGTAEALYTTCFSNYGIQVYNHSTNAECVIRYETIVKLVETKSTFTLFTKT